ncbi:MULTISPECIES: transposase [unclassified Limnohabitans]|nr:MULTISPECIES: transposase [unclassified Limnohabitans]
MQTTRFTGEQIIGFSKQAEAGVSIQDICCSEGFIQPIFYQWRSRLGS